MRGKRPKEREKYVLRMDDGTFVEVSREVYLEWHQSRRREKYQKERNQKNRVCSYEELEKAEKIHKEQTIARAIEIGKKRLK